MSIDLSDFDGGIRVSERLVDMPEHLTTEQPADAEMPAEKARSECYCGDCENRVTVGPDGDEYGHELTCQWSSYGRGRDE